MSVMFQFSDDIDEEDLLSLSIDDEKLTKTQNVNISACKNEFNWCSLSRADHTLLMLKHPIDDSILSAEENIPGNSLITQFNKNKSETMTSEFCDVSEIDNVDRYEGISSSSDWNVPLNELVPISRKKPVKIEYERKFPGPAGLIPKNKYGRNRVSPKTSVSKADLRIRTQIPVIDYSLLESRPWEELLRDLSSKSSELLTIINEYTVASLRKKHAINNTLWKIPLFAAVIIHIDFSFLDPLITLKDPSGEIRATIQKDLWVQYSKSLNIGSALLLRQVSLLSFPYSRKLYLHITCDALESIYFLDKDGKSVEVNRIAPPMFLQNFLDLGNEVSKARFSLCYNPLTTQKMSEIPFTNLHSSAAACDMSLHNSSILEDEFEGIDVDSLFDDF